MNFNWEKYQPIPGFSCVEMKLDVQEKIRKETHGLTLGQTLDYFRKQVEPLIKKYNLAPTDTPCRIAEDQTEYQKPHQATKFGLPLGLTKKALPSR